MIIPKIINCARCGNTHEGIEAKKFSNHPVFTHFAICPTSNEPILVDADEDNDSVITLDKFHYHEFLERAHLAICVIEEMYDHPVKDAHKDIQAQVDKILTECAELYQIVGQKDETWVENEFLPDVRNKLTPMLTLVGLVEDGVITDPKLETLVKETLEKVKENVEYLAKRNIQ